MKVDRRAFGMAMAVLLMTVGTRAWADGKPPSGEDCVVDGVHLYTPDLAGTDPSGVV